MQKIPLGPVRAITFDMYGTLLDLVASFGAGFEEFLEGRAYSGGADDVIQAWEATYLHESNADSLLGSSRTSFEAVHRVTLSQLFHKLNIPHTKGDIEQLVTTKATSILFPDLKEHLTRIQSLGIPVDRAISAEGAGYYKAPHRYLPACHEGVRTAEGAGAPRCRPRVGYPRSQGRRHGRGLH